MEYKLESHASLGFEEIINNFGNKDRDIKFRKEKIFILLTGKDENENQMKKRGIYIYRDAKNRQGHCNGYESYWE